MAYRKPAFHHGRLNRIDRRVGDADKKPYDQQTSNHACAGRKHFTWEPTGQACGDDPDHTRTGQRHPRAKQFAEYPSRQLAEGIAPYEGSINPTHLDLADAELGHHELARHVDVLAH